MQTLLRGIWNMWCVSGNRFYISGLAFPNYDHFPTEFSEGALMQFVPRRIPIEFRQPEFLPMGWGRAIPTAFVPMPETSVNEDGGFVFGQKNIHGDGAGRARRSARAVCL